MNKALACVILLTFLGCSNHPYEHGKRIYDSYCSNCHMPDGNGLRNLIPPLAQSDYLKANKSMLPCIITQGQKGPIHVNEVIYDQVMPASKLTDIQINNLINYINNEWGNDYGVTLLKETRRHLANCDESKGK